MNKGFTLVELLAILFILGIIIISVPNIINTNQKSKENECEQFLKTIENAAEVYVETHLELQTVQDLKTNNFSKLQITLDDLKKDGLLSSTIKTPKGKDINLASEVTATNNDGEITYEYNKINCQQEE